MPTYPELVIGHGASYYWRLNEASGLVAVDSKGLANGVISGGVTLGQPGALADGSKAMLFDGVSGMIQTGTVPNGILPLTTEAWIKTTDAGERCYVTDGPASNIYSGITGACLFYYGSAGSTTGVKPVNDGQWHHAVVIYSSTSITFYVDGILDVVRTLSPIYPPTGKWEIGNRTANNFINAWKGSIDEVAIYPKALVPEVIAEHYAARLDIGFVPVLTMIEPGYDFVLTPNQIYAIPTYPVSLASAGVIQTSIMYSGPFTNVSNGLINGCFLRSAGATSVRLSSYIIAS